MREGHAAARPPVVIDAQVHVYAANTPERPWHSVPNWPADVTGDEMVAAMDKVGVDGAIYISPFSMYQYDGSYAVSVQRAHPDKFALVKPATRMIRRWPMSSPTGRRRRARSASASS
jgi:predicted TIM-barrel fold metal-dependent hydrolase